jgi:hypothetical protein
MKRCFRRFRDDRFALTTLQNPTLEVRTHAELVAAAEREREAQRQPSATPANPPIAAPVAVIEAIPPPAPITPQEPPKDSVTANAAPPLEKKSANHPKRKPYRRKKSPPHRHARRRRKSAAKLAAAINSFITGEIAPDAAPAHQTAPENEQEIEQHVEEDYDDPNLPEPERHARKCLICSHPDRVGIEEHFLNWRNTELISRQYGLNDFRPIYRHARAIRVSARINDEGQWVEPPSHVIVSSGGRVTAPQYGPLPQISMTQVVLPPPIAQPPSSQPSIAQPEAPQFDFVPLEPAQRAVAQPEVPLAELAPLRPPTPESAATQQLGATNQAEEGRANLIGHTAIRNRRNPMKINGGLPF